MKKKKTYLNDADTRMLYTMRIYVREKSSHTQTDTLVYNNVLFMYKIIKAAPSLLPLETQCVI